MITAFSSGRTAATGRFLIAPVVLRCTNMQCYPSSMSSSINGGQTLEDDECHHSLCGPPLIRSPFDNPLRRYTPPSLKIDVETTSAIDLPAKVEGIGLKEFGQTTTLQVLQAFGRQTVNTLLHVRNAIRSTAYMPVVERNEAAAAHGTTTATTASMATAASTMASSDGNTEQDSSDTQQQNRREQNQRRQQRVLKYSMYSLVGMFGLGTLSLLLTYGHSPAPEHGDQYSDKNSAVAIFCRVRDALFSWHSFMREPIREKLLPDPVKPPWHQPKFTVVMEMRNVLVCPKWEYKKGHYFVKRSALDYFMDVAGYPNFELVIYTSETMMQAAPVVQQLDPKGNRISHALFRECTKTKFFDGTAIKDLSRLNRDLSKVIYIDWDPQAFQLNPENVLRVPKWEGNMEDTTLVDLAELLKTIHLSDVDDVRPTLQFYSQFDNPMLEFRKRAQQMAQQQQQSGHGEENSLASTRKRWTNFNAFGSRSL